MPLTPTIIRVCGRDRRHGCDELAHEACCSHERANEP